MSASSLWFLAYALLFPRAPQLPDQQERSPHEHGLDGDGDDGDDDGDDDDDDGDDDDDDDDDDFNDAYAMQTSIVNQGVFDAQQTQATPGSTVTGLNGSVAFATGPVSATPHGYTTTGAVYGYNAATGQYSVSTPDPNYGYLSVTVTDGVVTISDPLGN
jgi:hypothetical protein